MTAQLPTEQDRKNYSNNIATSPFYDKPREFLKLGQRVRAKFRIWDLPGNEPDWGWVSAEEGDEGVVVGVDDNWPTVRFERTGYATCVTDFEVDPI